MGIDARFMVAAVGDCCVVGGDGFSVGVLILSLKLGVRFGSALNFC